MALLNPALVIRHHNLFDRRPTVLARGFPHRRPAQIFVLTTGCAIGHGDDAKRSICIRLLSSFLSVLVFDTSFTPLISMRLSTALHMSYIVSAATHTAVSASISTPVCAEIFAPAVMMMRSFDFRDFKIHFAVRKRQRMTQRN